MHGRSKTPRPASPLYLRVFILALPALVLSGCAGYLAHRDGEALIHEGKLEEGVAKLREATREAPDNLKFRVTYARERERAAFNLLREADKLREQGKKAEEIQVLERVLAVEPRNERAKRELLALRGGGPRPAWPDEGGASEDRVEPVRAMVPPSSPMTASSSVPATPAVSRAGEQVRPGEANRAGAAVTARSTERSMAREGNANRAGEGVTAPAQAAQVGAANPTVAAGKNDGAKKAPDPAGLPASSPLAEAILAPTFRKPISLDFKDAPLRQIFDVVAHGAGLNIIFDKDVKADQRASIYLRNTTIETAIDYLLLTNQLEQRVMDAHTLLIYPNSEAKQKDYQPLAVKSFMLGNASAKSVAETLRALFKLKDVAVDEKLNMLIIRDSTDAIRLAEKLVALQDVPEPEVMLDVEVLEVSRNRLMELGVSLPASVSFTPLASDSGKGLTLADIRMRNLTGTTVGVVMDPVKISANKTDDDGNILANPRIRVVNREKAKITVGNRVPNIASTAVSANGLLTQSESVTYLDVGLKLDVEPTIYLDDYVSIRLGLEVTSIVGVQVTKSGTTAYTLGNRMASTVLRLKDGENQILAGLINDEDRQTANKLPGLGDIPVLGRLFGSTREDGKKTEIVLSITPHLIRNIKRPGIDASEFLIGTEHSLRRPSALPGTVAPPNGSSQKAVPEKEVPASPAAVPESSAPAHSRKADTLFYSRLPMLAAPT
jgi:type II secretory pathway component HofQ